MNASARPKDDADHSDVYSFFMKIENTEFPAKQNSTVIKYTKIPEFGIEAKGSWPLHKYTLQPRFRRIIALEDANVATTRSLKTNLSNGPKTMTNNIKRKIVTISEDDEYDLHPKFAQSKSARPSTRKTTNRSTGADVAKEKSPHKTPRQISSSRYLKETRPSAKSNNVFGRKENITNYKSKPSVLNKMVVEGLRSKKEKEKDASKSARYTSSSKNSLSKKYNTDNECEKDMMCTRISLHNNVKKRSTQKITENFNISKSLSPQHSESKGLLLHETKKYKPRQTIVHVPLEKKYIRPKVMERSITSASTEPRKFDKCDSATDTDIVIYKDMNIGTEPMPATCDQGTETDMLQTEILQKSICNTDEENSQRLIATFDDLHIPNVSLKTDISECRENVFALQSMSLPNLQVPTCQITPKRNEKSLLDTHYCKSTSYIISRSTLTYRTKQKINFHLVGSNDNAYSNRSPSPLSYPINVVSVFKEESSSKDISKDISMEDKQKNQSSKDVKNCINEIKSLDCSYVSNSDKLMKPSDIISAIRVNNGLLPSEYICDQFQRELNFIDSFFESLQYLESCSVSGKCLKDDKIADDISLLSTSIDVKNFDNNFLSKFENGANNDDTQTMASKNLLLLNILIRDEQRRAKNLLFVLKRREDALKHFTKSQILYLESKKKQDNTDISALKKKQRGALLKLQTECGEMQRMRKALLSISEKRKQVLMKTKKDLELKLKNNIDVEQIVLAKKRHLKRNTGSERTFAPLKCFDLSSSGCEDSTTSYSTESTSSVSGAPAVSAVTSVEKSIQTGDSILETSLVHQSKDPVGFVAVDGGYLNILFQNLSLPQIFSAGKQYDVNEEALKNIVESANTRNRDSGSDVEKLMDKLNNQDSNKSSTPSTARSLVEEFDQYYKGLVEGDKSLDEDSDKTVSHGNEIAEASECAISPCGNESVLVNSDSTQTLVEVLEEPCACEVFEQAKSFGETSPTGPLPQPAGAPQELDSAAPDAPPWLPLLPCSNYLHDSSSKCSELQCDPVAPMTSLAAPAHSEAEELRRQQLAIEQEIKELEQQQCQLVVVREIPNKPPPPYTAPDAREPSAFRADLRARRQIRARLEHAPAAHDPADAFHVFVNDFCEESLERYKPEQSDKPWDSCNLLPQKPPPDIEKLVENTSSDLAEVLTGVTPVLMSGVSSRRSDHIDELLFAEWRRVEPEWTSLHVDDASVKNQLFETIFQRILTETLDDYKQTVLNSPTN